MNILVTGAAGFIGKHYFKLLLEDTPHTIKGVEWYTYAADIAFLLRDKLYDNIYYANITDYNSLQNIFNAFKPDYVINFAAESHVDNSIYDATEFLSTNITGVYNLLTLCEKYKAMFHQISTDEVFGDRLLDRYPVHHSEAYKPSSPYAASKAAADQLVMAWGRTYQLPYRISYCTNNFGPRQHPEKFIPKTIDCLKNDKPIPVYGDGEQIREWLWVEDHVQALVDLLDKPGYQKVSIGPGFSCTNLKLIRYLANILNVKPRIKFVKDRLGHDRLYRLSPDISFNYDESTFIDYLTRVVNASVFNS